MKKLIFLILLLASQGFSYAQEFKINKVKDNETDKLAFQILKLVVAKQGFSEADIKQHSNYVPDAKLFDMVNSGELSLMWSGATKDLDEKFLAVRIPVFKGMLGHRIFIIRPDRQKDFDKVKTLDDLRKLKAGSGIYWGDTQILRDAKFGLVDTLKYKNLFPMLEGGRFDYFPRAIFEPWSEIETHKDLNLTVEKNLMLVYPLTLYFYVKKDNEELHNILYKGLEKAMLDGSYDKVFFGSKLVKEALQKTKIENRTIFRIPNKAMHKDTPFDRKEFWLDLDSLKHQGTNGDKTQEAIGEAK